uniref:Uncharacterized protein n=1 Tax=Panagrolaimus sp. ES5 TaxID=591445 RepID=A0AC34G4S5_9BILA
MFDDTINFDETTVATDKSLNETAESAQLTDFDENADISGDDDNNQISVELDNIADITSKNDDSTFTGNDEITPTRKYNLRKRSFANSSFNVSYVECDAKENSTDTLYNLDEEESDEDDEK